MKHSSMKFGTMFPNTYSRFFGLILLSCTYLVTTSFISKIDVEYEVGCMTDMECESTYGYNEEGDYSNLFTSPSTVPAEYALRH